MSFAYFCLMKKIIITGTSRGIGYEMALLFANAGHQVLAISRKTPQALIENENITCLSIDLSTEEDLYQVTDFLDSSWKNVDAIIHNAGALLIKPILKPFIESMFLRLQILRESFCLIYKKEAT